MTPNFNITIGNAQFEVKHDGDDDNPPDAYVAP